MRGVIDVFGNALFKTKNMYQEGMRADWKGPVNLVDEPFWHQIYVKPYLYWKETESPLIQVISKINEI